ncbi:MAG TPA: PEP-CTERM sorting domain-containing protein [Bryobacteraceae bacterium]|nr:PEP-CTERM sorting domain-containing protein [Bryobacteraceae bacterium]
MLRACLCFAARGCGLFTVFSAAVFGTPLLTIDYPGALGTRVSDVDNQGDIVGTYYGEPGFGSGSFFLRAGVFTPIAYPGALMTVAVGLSNTGQVAGWYLDGSAIQHGFLWNDGAYSGYDVPDASTTYLSDVNSSGSLLGGYCAGETCHGFFTDASGVHDLDVPGSDSTSPASINDRGAIAGYYLVSGYGIGFVRAPDGAVTPIEYHDPDVPVGITAPSGINNSGTIAGYIGYKYHGFLWRDGTFENFNVAAVTLPMGINDRGQVVGTYQDAAGEHGFLAEATDVPEPGTLAPGALGAAGLFAFGWRRRQRAIVDR